MISTRRRHRLFFVALVFLIAIFGATWYARQPHTVTNAPPKNLTIVAFGDSLTEGAGASRGNDYPSQLSRKLGLEVINRGVGGNTTAQALERLERDVLALNPGIVIVILGGNDFLRGIPREKVEENLAAIIQRLQAAGAVVVLGELRGNFATGDYGSMYRDLARRYGTALIPDLLDDILSHPGRKADPIHPNDEGYRLLTDRIETVVKPLVESAGRTASSEVHK